MSFTFFTSFSHIFHRLEVHSKLNENTHYKYSTCNCTLHWFCVTMLLRQSAVCCAADVHSWIHHCFLSVVTNLLRFSGTPFISWHYGAAGSLRLSNWCTKSKWQNNNNICLVSSGIDTTLQVPNCLCCEVCLDDTSSLWLSRLRTVSGFTRVDGWCFVSRQTSHGGETIFWQSRFNKMLSR